MNNVESLDDLFHKRVFLVPDYQRGYSWESRQVREFLEDLELLGSENFHYTGTVVLHGLHSERRWMDEDGNRYTSVAIVDGQQRLTTIVLLLDGVRRLLAKSSKKNRALAQGIGKNYIAVRARTGEPLYKLTLNTDTDHIFKANVLSDNPSVEGPNISSQKRLESAKNQIAAYLIANTDNGAKDGREWLHALYMKVTPQLCFTLYQVEHEAEVGVIFEVMNDRGKPLTELEKVKNYLLHASVFLRDSNETNQLADRVNGAWAEVLRELMSAGLESSADEDRLLRAHWLTHYDPQPRLWQGSKSIKDHFALRNHQEKRQALLGRLHRYTERLRQDCIAYCDAYEPTKTNAFDSFKSYPQLRLDVVEWSTKLVRIGVVAPFLPLLLAARIRWPERPDRYLELLQLCEAFAFRVYRVRQWRADAGQAALFRIGHKVWKKRMSYRAVIESIKFELAHRCGDDEFREFTSWEKPDDWYNWPGLRYFLYEYEIALALENGASPRVTWKELRGRELKNTIEHILPQCIENQPYWQRRFSAERHEKYVHDLGNLTLTKHNAQYSNKPFPDKKGKIGAKGRCYAKSPLYMEQALIRWKHWKASTIDERRASLLDWARDRWTVDLRGSGNGSDFGDVESDASDEGLEDAPIDSD